MKAFTFAATTLALLSSAADASMLRKSPRDMPGYEAFLAAKSAAQGTTDVAGQLKFQAASGPAVADYPDIFPANYTQPLDHFGYSTNVTFAQRYWYTLRHYKPPSERPAGQAVPVYILDTGESNGERGIKHLDHGILDILLNATGGIGIVLEHRYYGKSFPLRSDLGPGEVWTVDEMRWLTYNQTLLDSVRFVQNLNITGVDEDLTAPNATKAIAYGGSYPGTRSVHLRVLYPDAFFGAIASSAPVAAIVDQNSYFWPIARGTDPLCAQALQAAVAYIDSIVAPDPTSGSVQPKRDANATAELLSLFNLDGLKDPADFTNVISLPLGDFQGLNWDQKLSSKGYGFFCQALTNTTTSGPIPTYDDIKNGTVQPIYEPPGNSTTIPYNATASVAGKPVPAVVQRYVKYVRDELIDECVAEQGAEKCFGTSDWTKYTNATDPNEIAWQFQFCSTFSFTQISSPPVTAQPFPITFSLSGPKLVSTLLDYDYVSELCRAGFPAGKFFQMPLEPNVTEINSLGGFASPFDIAADRLAFINGQYDPWRTTSVHSEEYAYGGTREDTDLRPFILIPDAWHHLDENSLPAAERHLEPPRIKAVHERQVRFVKSWLGLLDGNNNDTATFQQEPPVVAPVQNTTLPQQPPTLSFARAVDALVL